MPNKECELQPNKIVPLFYPTFFSFLILKHSVLSNTHLLFHFIEFKEKTTKWLYQSCVFHWNIKESKLCSFDILKLSKIPGAGNRYCLTQWSLVHKQTHKYSLNSKTGKGRSSTQENLCPIPHLALLLWAKAFSHCKIRWWIFLPCRKNLCLRKKIFLKSACQVTYKLL